MSKTCRSKKAEIRHQIKTGQLQTRVTHSSQKCRHSSRDLTKVTFTDASLAEHHNNYYCLENNLKQNAFYAQQLRSRASSSIVAFSSDIKRAF